MIKIYYVSKEERSTIYISVDISVFIHFVFHHALRSQ